MTEDDLKRRIGGLASLPVRPAAKRTAIEAAMSEFDAAAAQPAQAGTRLSAAAADIPASNVIQLPSRLAQREAPGRRAWIVPRRALAASIAGLIIAVPALLYALHERERWSGPDRSAGRTETAKLAAPASPPSGAPATSPRKDDAPPAAAARIARAEPPAAPGDKHEPARRRADAVPTSPMALPSRPAPDAPGPALSPPPPVAATMPPAAAAPPRPPAVAATKAADAAPPPMPPPSAAPPPGAAARVAPPAPSASSAEALERRRAARPDVAALPAGAIVSAAATPVAAIPLVADTDAYRVLADMVEDGRRPDPASVRVGSLIHAIAGLAPMETPATAATGASTDPVAIAASVLPTPWDTGTRLVVVSLGISDRAQAGLPGVAAELSFNPARVRAYRRLGDSPTRAVALADASTLSSGPAAPRRDTFDLAPGYRVTAVYEISLVDAVAAADSAATSRAAASAPSAPWPSQPEIGTIEVSYRVTGRPTPDRRRLRITTGDARPDARLPGAAGHRLAVAAATFGERLAGQPAARAMLPIDILRVVQAAAVEAPVDDGRRLVELVRRALALGW